MNYTGLKVIVIALGALLVINIAIIAFLLGRPAATPPAGAPIPSPSPSANSSPAVSLTLISAPCADCFNGSLYQPQLANAGVKFGTVTQLDSGTAEAQKAIGTYGIQKLPALIFSKELGSYSQVAGSWQGVGTIAKDGSYILQGLNPPYYDLATKSVKGLVTLTYVNDSLCQLCYDVTLHLQVHNRFGMRFKDIRTVDVSSPEGRSLVAKYNITATPTVVLSADAGLYPSFDQVWSSVGIAAADGSYVFTELGAIGRPYKNGTRLVVPVQPQNGSLPRPNATG
jgi:hypothetical protein